MHITSTVTSKVVGTGSVKPVKVDSLDPADAEVGGGPRHARREGRRPHRDPGRAQHRRQPRRRRPTRRRTRPPTRTAARSSRTSRSAPTRSRSTRPATSTASGNQMSQTTATVVAKKVVLRHDVLRRRRHRRRRRRDAPPGHRPGTPPPAAQRRPRRRARSRRSTAPTSACCAPPRRPRAATPVAGQRPVPVRRELLRLLHRRLPVHVTRQGDRADQHDDAAVAELLQHHRRSEPRRGGARRPGDQRSARDGPPAAVQHPRQPQPRRQHDLGRLERRVHRVGRAAASRPGTRRTAAPRRPSALYTDDLADAAGFGTAPRRRTTATTCRTQSAAFDPGLPFGTYDICLRDTATPAASWSPTTLQQHAPRTARRL